MTTKAVGVAVVCAALAGCAGQKDRNRVAGTVTFRGQPVTSGAIHFDPDPARGGKGVQGYADITNGKFDTSLSERGAPPGPVVVRILGRNGEKSASFPLGVPILKWETPTEVAEGSQVKDFDVPATAAVKPPAAVD